MPSDPDRRTTYGGKPLSTKYRGVHKVKCGKFMAQVFVKGTRHYLGLWPIERGASLARDRALLHLRVYQPKLNLPALATKNGPASPEELISQARRLEKRETRGA